MMGKVFPASQPPLLGGTAGAVGFRRGVAGHRCATAHPHIRYLHPPARRPVHSLPPLRRKLEDSTSDEKGNLVFDLKKTWGDNLYFWAVGKGGLQGMFGKAGGGRLLGGL